jgi:thiol-disulfide isomerase/thioredoxin
MTDWASTTGSQMKIKVLATTVTLSLSLSAAATSAWNFDDDDKPKTPANQSDSRKPKLNGAGTTTDRPVAEQITKLRADYEADRARVADAVRKGNAELKRWRDAGGVSPDFVAHARQLVDLASLDPKNPASRDALIWVIYQPSRGDNGSGPYPTQFARAVDLLVQHHADDPEVARVGLTLDNNFTRRRDAFLEGMYASAEDGEAKGLARMSLAIYLARKSLFVESAHKKPNLPRQIDFETAGSDGKPRRIVGQRSNEELGYWIHLRSLDPIAVRAEADQLFQEVIAEYGDIPFITRQHRTLEALVQARPPETIADPEEKARMIAVQRRLAKPKTLAEVADERLDEMYNLVVGKPAPEIEGATVDGKAMKLSDYRGKVVVVVFWGSWCGPCMRQVPHERELVKRLKDKPFALLGVDCDESKQDAIDAIKENAMAWPSWYDGAPGAGPIVGRYHVRGYPRMFVLDGRGIIRHNGLLEGGALDSAVDSLLREFETERETK